MKRYLLIILLIPFIISWKWATHEAFMESIYYQTDLRTRLDLEELKRGSIAPDKDFHDNRKHHYPPSYNLTLFWLNMAENALKKNNTKNTSYSFGVASHYVSDSFATPHYISKEPSYLHSEFESQVKKLETKCRKRQFNLRQELEKASENGKYWDEWLNTKNPNLVQEQSEQSMDLIFQLALSVFNSECLDKKTEFKKIYFIINKELLLYFSATLSFLLFFRLRKSPDN